MAEKEGGVMERISIPVFEPCAQCAGGMILRNGRQERCDCWLKWWARVRASLVRDK